MIPGKARARAVGLFAALASFPLSAAWASRAVPAAAPSSTHLFFAGGRRDAASARAVISEIASLQGAPREAAGAILRAAAKDFLEGEASRPGRAEQGWMLTRKPVWNLLGPEQRPEVMAKYMSIPAANRLRIEAGLEDAMSAWSLRDGGGAAAESGGEAHFPALRAAGAAGPRSAARARVDVPAAGLRGQARLKVRRELKRWDRWATLAFLGLPPAGYEWLLPRYGTPVALATVLAAAVFGVVAYQFSRHPTPDRPDFTAMFERLVSAGIIAASAVPGAIIYYFGTHQAMTLIAVPLVSLAATAAGGYAGDRALSDGWDDLPGPSGLMAIVKDRAQPIELRREAAGLVHFHAVGKRTQVWEFESILAEVLDHDADAELRVRAAELLGEGFATTSVSRDALFRALQDGHEDVRSAAARALAR